jgi:hypothetical protein
MKRISQAAVAMEDREEKLDAIYNMIEKDLSLVGRALGLLLVLYHLVVPTLFY